MWIEKSDENIQKNKSGERNTMEIGNPALRGELNGCELMLLARHKNLNQAIQGIVSTKNYFLMTVEMV